MKREIFYRKEIKFSNGEKIVIDFIERETDKFVKSSISELSKATYISAGSISKLSRKLGFTGYKQMQQWVLLQMQEYNQNEIVSNPQKTDQVVKNTALYYERAIKRTTSDLVIDKIDLAMKEIKEKKFIFTYGIGSSSLAAQELSEGLSTLSYNASNQKTIHDIFLKINDSIIKSSAVIVFSKSFASKELKSLRSILSKQGIRMVIITANTKLVENSNEVIIRFRTFEQKKRSFAISSKISELLICDVILSKLKTNKKNTSFELFDAEWRKN